MFRDYGDQVNFFYIYKRLAHPETNNFVEPATLEERRMHVAEAIRMTGTKIPWLCDSMDNAATLAFGQTYNGEFVIDPEGHVVRQRFWSSPTTLRKDLEKLVGTIENPTQVSDLDVRFRPEPRKIASGVVPRIALPRGLAPIQVKHIPNQERPAYFKLRAELTRQPDSHGNYKMYLGFYPDPIHRVHWNNAAGPVKVDLQASEQSGLRAQSLTGPVVQEAADVDPRMFLVDVDSKASSDPIQVKLHCVVCDDAETFCLPMTQEYEVFLKPRGDGSTRPDIFLSEIFANVRNFDKNKDGKITLSELPTGRVTMYTTHLDYNLDNQIDEAEIAIFERMYNNGRGFEVKP